MRAEGRQARRQRGRGFWFGLNKFRKRWGINTGIDALAQVKQLAALIAQYLRLLNLKCGGSAKDSGRGQLEAVAAMGKGRVLQPSLLRPEKGAFLSFFYLCS